MLVELIKLGQYKANFANIYLAWTASSSDWGMGLIIGIQHPFIPTADICLQMLFNPEQVFEVI